MNERDGGGLFVMHEREREGLFVSKSWKTTPLLTRTRVVFLMNPYAQDEISLCKIKMWK